MALTVETGAVVAGAESYISVADANTYWSNRNNSVWPAASEAAREAALREATQFLDASYVWIGVVKANEQPLMWPRVAGVDRAGRYLASDSIPAPIKAALCELALEALSGRLMATLERGGRIASESVGALAVSYFPDAPGGKRYPFISLLVKDLAVSGAGSLTMEASRG